MVKMLGYWKFFYCVFMGQDKVKIHKLNLQRKNEANMLPSYLAEQAWSIKDLLYGNNGSNSNNKFVENRGQSQAGKIGPSCLLV